MTLPRHPSVVRLLAATEAPSAEAAIRARAQALVAALQDDVVWEGPPFDILALASYCGYEVTTTDDLLTTQDACVVPGHIFVNRRKPLRRQRYSIAHELAHTLFPDYREGLSSGKKLWRAYGDSEDSPGSTEFERLCQIGASELLLPRFAFVPRIHRLGLSLDAIYDLSTEFQTSVEAAARRAVDVTENRVILAFAQAWDAAAGCATSVYSVLAELRITRSYGSSPCGLTRLRPGTTVPPASSLLKAWRRAVHPRTRGRCYASTEVWRDCFSERMPVDSVRCEALALPLDSASPREVIALLHIS